MKVSGGALNPVIKKMLKEEPCASCSCGGSKRELHTTCRLQAGTNKAETKLKDIETLNIQGSLLAIFGKLQRD